MIGRLLLEEGSDRARRVTESLGNLGQGDGDELDELDNEEDNGNIPEGLTDHQKAQAHVQKVGLVLQRRVIFPRMVRPPLLCP